MATILHNENVERLIAEAHVYPLIGKVRKCPQGAKWTDGRQSEYISAGRA